MVPKLACYDILGAVSFLKPQPNLFLWRFSFHIINKCSTCAPKEALNIFHNFYTISRLLWKRQNICQGQWSQTLIQSRWVLPPGINTVFCNTCNHYIQAGNPKFRFFVHHLSKSEKKFEFLRLWPESSAWAGRIHHLCRRRRLASSPGLRCPGPAKPCQPFKFKRCSWPWGWSYKCQKYQRQRIVFNDRRTSWHRRHPRW